MLVTDRARKASDHYLLIEQDPVQEKENETKETGMTVDNNFPEVKIIMEIDCRK